MIQPQREAGPIPAGRNPWCAVSAAVFMQQTAAADDAVKLPPRASATFLHPSGAAPMLIPEVQTMLNTGRAGQDAR